MSMKKVTRWLVPRLVPLIYLIVRTLGLTVRINAIGWDRYKQSDASYIFAGWHGQTLLPANFFKGMGLWTIISQSRDGEMQNRIFQKFGFRTIRGSSSRGGVAAAIESIKVLKAGGKMAFTVDGPRGPSGIVQEGVVMIAMKSGAQVVPCGVSARRRKLARSWDRYMIPKPFTQAVILFGDALRIEPKSTPEQQEEFRLRVEAAIHRCQAEADRLMGHSG